MANGELCCESDWLAGCSLARGPECDRGVAPDRFQAAAAAGHAPLLSFVVEERTHRMHRTREPRACNRKQTAAPHKGRSHSRRVDSLGDSRRQLRVPGRFQTRRRSPAARVWRCSATCGCALSADAALLPARPASVDWAISRTRCRCGCTSSSNAARNGSCDHLAAYSSRAERPAWPGQRAVRRNADGLASTRFAERMGAGLCVCNSSASPGDPEDPRPRRLRPASILVLEAQLAVQVRFEDSVWQTKATAPLGRSGVVQWGESTTL